VYVEVPLRGPTPCELGSLKKLNILNLGSNASTTLTPCLGEVSLAELVVSSNEMVGVFPNEVLAMSSLAQLEFADNLFEGLGSVSALTGLTALLGANNKMTGEIPAFMGKSKLTTIDLRGNKFTSVSSSGFSGLPKLTGLFLQNSDLSGGIPVLASLPAVKEIDLSGNSFTGPPVLGCSLTDLQSLAILRINGQRVRVALLLGVVPEARHDRCQS
jgi:Leucine-rich repeat (LRR) protein